MTQRNYDPDLAPLISLLPDISDLSTAEKIQAVRSGGRILNHFWVHDNFPKSRFFCNFFHGRTLKTLRFKYFQCSS